MASQEHVGFGILSISLPIMAKFAVTIFIQVTFLFLPFSLMVAYLLYFLVWGFGVLDFRRLLSYKNKEISLYVKGRLTFTFFRLTSLFGIASIRMLLLPPL